jgi:hypothetical protein
VRAGFGQFGAYRYGSLELFIAGPAVQGVRCDAIDVAVARVAVHAAGVREQVRKGDGLQVIAIAGEQGA